MGYEKEQLLKTIRISESLLKKYMVEMENLPEGRLIAYHDGGRMYYQHARRVGSDYCRTGITRKPEMIRCLARRRFLEEEVGILDKNIRILKGACEKIRSVDPEEVIASLTKPYRNLPRDMFLSDDQFVLDHRLTGETLLRLKSHKAWAEAPYERYDEFPENRDKMTSFGLWVRSKSEQLIAEQLHGAGVPFRYEQVLRIGPVTLVPDFTFQDRTGGLFFWEHAGMMDQPNYEQRHQSRMMDYRSIGIVPWKNLIVTYEHNNVLNMGMVDAIIRNEVIPRL